MTAPRSNTPTIDRLLDSEEDPSRLWAEIHRLRAALQGPGGYATWQDAATAERIRRVKAEKYLANFDIAGLGAVLTYTSHGRSSVHGMTIGADGSGDFAVLFMGAWADSESAAAEYLGRLQQAGYRISTAHIVPNQRRFSGDSVRVVDAPLARIGRRTEPCDVCGAVEAPEEKTSMSTPRTRTPTLIAAMRILASDIKSPDGVVNAAILEAAERLDEMRSLMINADLTEMPDWFQAAAEEAIK